MRLELFVHDGNGRKNAEDEEEEEGDDEENIEKKIEKKTNYRVESVGRCVGRNRVMSFICVVLQSCRVGMSVGLSERSSS